MRNANIEYPTHSRCIVIWSIRRAGAKSYTRTLVVWPSSMLWRAEEVIVHLRESFPDDTFVILPEGEEPE